MEKWISAALAAAVVLAGLIVLLVINQFCKIASIKISESGSPDTIFYMQDTKQLSADIVFEKANVSEKKATDIDLIADDGITASVPVESYLCPIGATAEQANISLTEGSTEDVAITYDFGDTGLTEWNYTECWSDDESIATIAKYTVTGVNPGTTTVHIAMEPDHKVVVDVAVTVNEWVPDASTKAGREALAQQKAKEIVAQIITPGMSDYEKASAIYNWMVANVGTQYNQSNAAYKTNYGNEAYSAFFMGVSACSGHCRANVMLCQAAGLGVKHVNPGLWCHQWNLVDIDGTWTVMDTQGQIFGGTTHPLQNEPAYYKDGIAYYDAGDGRYVCYQNPN